MSELFAEIISWAVRNGANRVDELDVPWRGETDQWRVAINATGREIDGIPHMMVMIEHKEYMRLCLVGPAGGAIIGDTEIALIEHFKQAN